MGQQYAITGYHGTTMSSAEKIFSTKVFYDSEKKSEWLGKGTYFFAYKCDAVDWAKKEVQKPENSGQKGAVLSARLEFDDEQLLDLDDSSALEQMHETLKSVGCIVGKHISADCSKLTGPDLWKQWYFNCEIYKKTHPEIGIITYTFRFPNKFDERWFGKNQKQICVSKHEIIKDIAREGLL